MARSTARRSTYPDSQFAPTLHDADVVILYNLAAHKGEKAAQCLKQRGPGSCPGDLFCPSRRSSRLSQAQSAPAQGRSPNLRRALASRSATSAISSSRRSAGTTSKPPDMALKNGSFLSVWEDMSQTGEDTSVSGIRGQMFNADGTKKGVILSNRKSEGGMPWKSLSSAVSLSVRYITTHPLTIPPPYPIPLPLCSFSADVSLAMQMRAGVGQAASASPPLGGSCCCRYLPLPRRESSPEDFMEALEREHLRK